MVITVAKLRDLISKFPDDAVVADVIDDETLADIFQCSVIEIPEE